MKVNTFAKLEMIKGKFGRMCIETAPLATIGKNQGHKILSHKLKAKKGSYLHDNPADLVAAGGHVKVHPGKSHFVGIAEIY